MSGKRILFFLVLIGGGITAWLLLSPPAPQVVSDPSQASGISLFGYDEHGKVAWTVQAETGEVKKGEESRLSGVSLRFMSDGADELEATCDTLSYSGDEASLVGNVTLSDSEELSLVTQSADWNTTAKQISASDVTIGVQSGSVSAPVFCYQTEERRAVMSGGIRAELTGASLFTVEGDEAEAQADLIIIDGNVHVYVDGDTYTADHLEYSTKGAIATLSGDVVGSFSHGQITARELVIGKNEVSASGGVRISLKSGFFGGS
ncbi:hypothetical protein J7K60_01145 [Candidatus Bipolaricaulota bacterium]|nr:hypothetical protein [Candidatus Bipolaricaulota bacterium]